VGLQLASEAFADDELLGIAATVHRHVRPQR
jgi:Asp-tRNA(Asn)/Glu-tRNA(Gln) amidotransferase A subunit family amidase